MRTETSGLKPLRKQPWLITYPSGNSACVLPYKDIWGCYLGGVDVLIPVCVTLRKNRPRGVVAVPKVIV